MLDELSNILKSDTRYDDKVQTAQIKRRVGWRVPEAVGLVMAARHHRDHSELSRTTGL